MLFHKNFPAISTAQAHAIARKPAKNKNKQMSERVRKAIADPYTWVRQYTETYNEHWVEEKRLSPYEAFPDWPFIESLFELFLLEPIVLIEKSRDMMVSWCCVAYFTWEAMRIPERGVLFQTQKEDKVKQLIKYAKCLYERQPPWLKDAFPLAKPLKRQPDLSLTFANGSNIVGIPGGANQVRSYHPWGYFNDETAFQPEAGESYNEALAAAHKVILCGTAGPGWYADFKNDRLGAASE